MEPGDYGFTVYAGDDEVASVSGPKTVTTDYTDVKIESSDITDGLSGKLNEASIQIRAAASPYMKLTRVRMVVEYEPESP